ncbi:hypothetical protein ES044_09990 [Polaribacter sp. IC066]|uniref:hypothetical protein n=1 Tax=Polaribacter sp. IC066 TaxID=57032 RepID=UPI0011BEFF4E|nr:hypothetical protein [Polaribacter sp. IC066]TXD59457.1 hypothetical protein ES044_09990 [Polaribacter sp. IC066]
MTNSRNLNSSAFEDEMAEQKNLEELDLWASFLNRFTEEYEGFIITASSSANKEDLQNQLLTAFKNNETILRDILNYKRATHNFMECIDLACDSFYKNKYLKIKKAYVLHAENCSLLKKKVFFRSSSEGLVF